MLQTTYEQLSQSDGAREWLDDEESVHEVDGGSVTDVKYGGIIRLALSCIATLIIGSALTKLLLICDDVDMEPSKAFDLPTYSPSPGMPVIEICTPSAPRGKNTICFSPGADYKSSQGGDAISSHDAATYTIHQTSDRDNDLVDTLPIISLTLYILVVAYVGMKRLLRSYNFSAPCRLMLLFSTIFSIVSLSLFVRDRTQVSVDDPHHLPSQDTGGSMLWQALNKETVFLEWVTQLATIAWNISAWWYLSIWESWNSWEARERRRLACRDGKLDQLYRWDEASTKGA